LNDPAVLEDGRCLQDFCRFANPVGAIATAERGAIPSLPTKDRAHAFKAQQSAG
jgi:sugar/nucleoside kinase (ribokinase family)